MKIVRTAEEVSEAAERKRIANLNCDKCPCCGETKEIKSEQRTWYTGFLNMKIMHCDWYNCLVCGAVWKSEPYEGI